MLHWKFIFLWVSATSALAELESFESQQVQTKEPLTLEEVTIGEQDDISHTEESQELTERPVQHIETEDEPLLEDSTVDYEEVEDSLPIIQNNDLDTEPSTKEVTDSDFLDIENDVDYSYDNYPSDTEMLEEYYDDDFESFKEVPLYDVLGKEQVSLDQVVEIEPQDFDLTTGSIQSDGRFIRQSDLSQLSQEEDGVLNERKARQFNNQQFGFQQQQQQQQPQQRQQQQTQFTEQQQFAQQQQQFVQRQQQLIQQQQQQLVAQQQQQFPAQQQQTQQFFAQPQQQQQSAQSTQFQSLGAPSTNQFTQRFTTPGFQTRFPQQGQPQNQFSPQAPQPQTQFAQQPVQPQNDFLQPQTQFAQQPRQPQFSPQQFQSNQFPSQPQAQQTQQFAPQQQQFSQPQQPAQQFNRFVSFGQEEAGQGQNQISFTTPRPEAQRQSGQSSFQSFPARPTPQPTRQPIIPQGTPQSNFQAFQSGRNQNDIQVRPVGQPGFNLQDLGFQGFDFGNTNAITNTQQQQFLEPEPQTRRPPNARPPPNADPRQNRFTTPRPQVGPQQFQVTPGLSVKAPRLNDPVSNFIQGNTLKQTLRQEPANQITLQPFTTPRGPELGVRSRQPVTPSILKTQNSITTFRPIKKNNQIEPTRLEPNPQIPGGSNGSPSFANFPAGKPSGAGKAVPETKKPKLRGSRKRLRLRKKPEDVKGGDFIPTPPPTSSRQRTRPKGNSNSFIPTPPPTGRRGSRIRTQNKNIPEAPRSSGIQPNSNSVINLAELAGVKELETALRQRDKEIRNLKSQLNEAERSFENQLNQQSRKLTKGSGQVKELEITLRDQTRRLAESTKKIFDYQQTINDLEKNIKQKDRVLRDRDSTLDFQSQQLKEMIELENQVQDYKRELTKIKNDLNSRGRKVKELEQLTIKQDQITVDNVKKIQLIESTIDEVEQIVFSKDQVIQNLQINIEEFRRNSDKDARKIDELEGDLDQRTREVIDKDRKLREFKQTLANQQAVLNDKDTDIAELNDRTRLHLDYAAEKQKEISQLETAVATLRNTTIVKDEQIISLGKELKLQVGNLNAKIQESENLKANVSQGIEQLQRRDQKIGTLEGAVTSLKEIIQQNNIKIGNLKKEVEQKKVEVTEKDKFIQTQRERLTQASKSIKDLQILLGDAGNTLDSKNIEIEELEDKVETFKLDKKNLLGIVQQLATIGNPAFNFQSFMDSVSEKTEKEKAESRSFKSAPLVAQESQRSIQIVNRQGTKRRSNKKPLDRKQLQSIPRQQKVIELHNEPSQPQRRSFADNLFNSIQTPVVREDKDEEEINFDYKDYEIRTDDQKPHNILEEDKDISIFVEIEGDKANEKDQVSTTTITSLLDDFPSFIAMAKKLTTAVPDILTSKPTTTTVPTTTTTEQTTTTASTTTTTTTTTTSTTTTTTTSTTTTTTSTTTQEQTTISADISPSVVSPKASSEPMPEFSLMVTPKAQHTPIFVGMDSVKISKNLSLERADNKSRSRVSKPSKRKLGRKVSGAGRKRFGQKLGFQY